MADINPQVTRALLKQALMQPSTDARDAVLLRESEVDELAAALADKQAVVLLGGGGVGKTAVTRRLVQRIADGTLPALAGVTIHRVTTADVMVNTSFTGQLETRAAHLIEEAGAQRVVCFENLFALPSAGSYDTNPRGLYDLLRSAIKTGRLRIMGEAAEDTWEKACGDHPELREDFRVVRVRPFEDADARHILRMLVRDAWSKDVAWDRRAVERVETLTRRYVPWRASPGKSLDAVRETVQAAGLRPPSERARPIDAAYVDEVFARSRGLALHLVSPDVAQTYEQMRDFLAERVLGQPDAVRQVADRLALYKAGLNDPQRPPGVWLFVGPTGVGKTELAKAVAEYLFGSSERIFRLDLSEYKDYHAFEKLIGRPGSTEPGTLIAHMRERPFTVLLLDEFEKAHPNIADLFLQVFDAARLSGQGGTVDFRHAFIILTSNVGAALEDPQARIGFGGGADADADARGALDGQIRKGIEGQWRPEFLNRIDRVVVFRPLSREVVAAIARKEVARLHALWGFKDRGLMLEVGDDVIDRIVERGFDRRWGARPLKRAVEEHLVLPVARRLLDGQWERFQIVRATCRGDEVRVTLEDTEASRKSERLSRVVTVDAPRGRRRLTLREIDAALRDLATRLRALETDWTGGRFDAEVRARRMLGSGADRELRAWLDEQVRACSRSYESLRALVEASYEEGDDAVLEDVASAFADFEVSSERVDRHLRRFTAPTDACDVRLRIHAEGGADQTLARELAETYRSFAARSGFEATTREVETDVVIELTGWFAYGTLRGEHGRHRFIDPPADPDDPRGAVTLVRVAVEAIYGAAIHPAATGAVDEVVRVYDRWHSPSVKCRRTGYTNTDLRRVMAGLLDGFIDARVDAERRAEGGA